MAETVEKIDPAYVRRAEHGLASRIEIDGGVNRETANAGPPACAGVSVSSTMLFGAADMERAARELRALAGFEHPAST